MGTVGLAQTLTCPNTHMCLPPKSTGSIARLFSAVGTLVVYTDIPQMQDLPRQSVFYPWLLQMHREISIPFFLVVLPMVLSFGFGPTFVCVLPSGVCFPSRQEGMKAVTDWGTLTHSGWGRLWQPQLGCA